MCKGAQQHEEVQLGLLYAILTDPPSAPKVMEKKNVYQIVKLACDTRDRLILNALVSAFGFN